MRSHIEQVVHAPVFLRGLPHYAMSVARCRTMAALADGTAGTVSHENVEAFIWIV